MKKLTLCAGMMLVWSLFPLIAKAQDYHQLWKEVEVLQKKDLPQSVIKQTDLIYAKAFQQQNNPQRLKALIIGTEYRTMLSPDSLVPQVVRIQKWLEEEKDVPTQAMLHAVLGKMMLNLSQPDIDAAIAHFHCSVEARDLLGTTPAKNFYPAVESKEVSQKFFHDSMLDFLSRHAIKCLSLVYTFPDSAKAHKAIMDFYQLLSDFYSSQPDKYHQTAAALTECAKIIYLTDNCRHINAQIGQRECVHLLEKLAANCQDTEAYADIALKLADKYLSGNQPEKAMKLLQKAITLYPESYWKNDLNEMVRFISRPILNLTTPLVYPEYDSKLIVNYQNLTDMKVELFRLNLPPSSSLLRNQDYGTLAQKYGTRTSINHFALLPTSDYRMKEVELPFKMPQAGIYVLKATASTASAKPSYDLLYISPYQCIILPKSKKEKELTVVDRLTGHPVPHAEIVSYKINRGGEFTTVKVYTTDEKGNATINLASDQLEYFNVRTKGNDFMQIQYQYIPQYSHRQKEKTEKTHTSLFTDRALYRPGQKVQLSGFKYRQWGDSLDVVRGSDVTVTLSDDNGKILKKEVVKTDEFGVYSAEFILDKQLLPGFFTVTADHQGKSFKVEEYKRPTFDVRFNQSAQTYTFGDTVKASAIAQTFSGAPLQLARVNYTITRAKSWWRTMRNESAMEIASGECMTDGQGKFTVHFPLAEPADNNRMPAHFYLYQVAATVTSGAGESQVGVWSVPVGRKSLGLDIKGLKSLMAKEKKEKIQLSAINMNNVPVQTAVNYTVYRLNANNKKEGAACCSGKQDAMQSFVPEELYALPSGKYRMEISAQDDKGRNCSYGRDFILFSLADTRPPVNVEHWYYQDGDNFGQSATDSLNQVDVYVGSSKQNVCLFVNTYTAGKRLSSERVMLNNEIKKFSYQYQTNYGDGIKINFTFIIDGKCYTKNVALSRPVPNKTLKLEWESFRDKLTPGQEEEWVLRVKNNKGKGVQANLLASAYDTSLDQIWPHRWYFALDFFRDIPHVDARHLNFNPFYLSLPFQSNGYHTGIGTLWDSQLTSLIPFNINRSPRWLYSIRGNSMKRVNSAGDTEKSMSQPLEDMEEGFTLLEENVAVECCMDIANKVEEPVKLRQNFSETAFFYPALRTDSAGKVLLNFTMPDALTQWKLNAFAHTQEMDYGSISALFTTTKPFMVQPNMPRFIRIGDQSSITSSLINLSTETVSGTITLALSDPFSGKEVYTDSKEFIVEEGKTGTVTFSYLLNENHDLLTARIVAKASKFSDGELNYLPILTNRQWVNENISVQLSGNEQKEISLDKLFNHHSKTADHRRVSIEMTANPHWYVLQALPVMGTPEREDAIAWATAYYANAISRHLIMQHPAIQQTLGSWLKQGKQKNDFWNTLSSNEEVKELMVKETPWLAEAENDETRKLQLATLFNKNAMDYRQQKAMEQLSGLQLTNGAWSWFKGMTESRYITTQIVYLLARLRSMGIATPPQMEERYIRALKYLHQEMVQEDLWLSKHPKGTPSEASIKLLYCIAIDTKVQAITDRNLNRRMIERLLQRSASFGIFEKSMIAVIMDANQHRNEAEMLMKSVMEYLVKSDEMGYYFDSYKAEYSATDYRIPTQVAAMEALARLTKGQEATLNGMKHWLLTQKQIQVWDTPIASADAVYAFIMKGEKEMTSPACITAQTGKDTISTPNDVLGHTQRTYSGNDLKQILSAPVTFTQNGTHMGWASIRTGYLEEIDRLSSFQKKELSIHREYLYQGQKINQKTALRPGNKITVRLTIKADRDMDFICLKDGKAACMEATSQVSGYRLGGQLSFYQINRDSSTEFFIEKLYKGTHIITYEVYLSRSGNYHTGAATVFSVYAPQFSSHTKGSSLNVK